MTIGKDLKVPQLTTYSMGVDIAAGSGASDSVISIADNVSKRKVFEFKTNGMLPINLAKLTAIIYKWFTTSRGAPFLAWDGGGHGIPYGSEIMRLGSMHVYYYKSEVERKAKKKRAPGMPSSKEIKTNIMNNFRAALFSGAYISPSEEMYRQAEQFVYEPDGKIVHSKCKTTDDYSDAGEQHGDVVTSEVILWIAICNRQDSVTEEKVIPIGSFAWRREQRKRQEKRLVSMFEAG